MTTNKCNVVGCYIEGQHTHETATGNAPRPAPTEQEIAEAVEAAKAVCWFDWSDNDDDAVAAVERLRAALATLANVRLVAVPEGHHVYTSRFNPGDEVFTYVQGYAGSWVVVSGEVEAWRRESISDNAIILTLNMGVGRKQYGRFDSDCFPTRSEAEAECARRNADKGE